MAGQDAERVAPRRGGGVVVLADPAPVSGFTALVDRARAAAGLPPDEAFALFVATDHRPAQPEVFAAFAEHCLRRGVYAVSTCPGCEVAHDIVDEVEVAMYLDRSAEVPGGPAPGSVLTSWHSHESVGEALHFFLTSSFAAEGRPHGRLYLVLRDADVDAAGIDAWLTDHAPPVVRLRHR